MNKNINSIHFTLITKNKFIVFYIVHDVEKNEVKYNIFICYRVY